MDGIHELAKLLYERSNPEPYSPVAGVVEDLPEIKIRLNEKVVLGRALIYSTVDLLTQNADGAYIWQGRTVFLLPMLQNGRLTKYLVIGGDAI